MTPYLAEKLRHCPQAQKPSHTIYLYTYDIVNLNTDEAESMVYLLSPLRYELTGDPIDFMRVWHAEQYSQFLSDIGKHSVDLASSAINLDECFKIDLASSYSGILGSLLRYPIKEGKFIWSIEDF